MACNREWSSEYLRKQHQAIRWLSQFIGPNQIRTLTWGVVDESAKTLKIRSKITTLITNLDNNSLVKREESYKEFMVDLRGTECEWFFLESRIHCAWIFTKQKPKTWRKQGSMSSLYAPAEIKAILEAVENYLGKTNISMLTNPDYFDIIELSNLNITKMETRELERKAIEVS